MAGNHTEAGGEAAFTELSPHIATAPVCTTPPPYAHGTVNKTRSTSQASMIPSHCLCLEEVSALGARRDRRWKERLILGC